MNKSELLFVEVSGDSLFLSYILKRISLCRLNDSIKQAFRHIKIGTVIISN